MVAEVVGDPEITGAVFVFDATVIENISMAVVALPSLMEAVPSFTLITMLEYLPATVGVPLKRPVAVLKVAHEGGLIIEKVSGLPSASDAVG